MVPSRVRCPVMISAPMACEPGDSYPGTVLILPETRKRRLGRRSTSRPNNSGGGIRTRDLRVMSPTSYQTAPPRNKDTKYTPGARGCQP